MPTEDILIQLGLTKLEAKAYLALLSLGGATALPIARKAGIKRTSIYNFIEHLIDMGLVSKTTRNSRTVFVAEPPERLEGLLEEKKEILDKNLESLKSLFAQSSQAPVFRYIRGVAAVKGFYKESLKMKGKIIRFIATKEAGVAYLGVPLTNRLIENYARLGVKEKTLRHFGQKASHKYASAEDNKRLGREVRLLPQGIDLKFSVVIYDDKVGLLAPIQENYGFIIQSQSFAHLMTVFFDQMWQISKGI